MRGCLLLLVMITLVGLAQGQKLMKIETKHHPVICYARFDNCESHVPPPKEYFQRKAARAKTATIEVTFSSGFPVDAQAAFQQAVDIWETIISSPVPIKVQANWSPLGSGVLGSAIYWSAFANFDGAQKQNVFYPVALAEKMAGKELNEAEDFEIFANFSSNMNWYFGSSGTPAANQFDFITVVMHEIGHGLGFSGSFGVENNQGTVGAFSTDVPIVFDAFVETGSGVKLLTFNSPSAQLRAQLTSQNLRIIVQKNAIGSSLLYAPTTFDDGSSISHLDEASYPPGANALMTPQIGFQEVNHDPGPLASGILSDMGWEMVRINHQPLPNTENETGPYVVNVKLINDEFVSYNAANVKLNYTSDGTTFTPVVMTDLGNDEFSASIPTPPNIPWTYGYFISVGDNVGRTVLKPGKVVTVGQPAETQNLMVFTIGPDTENPKIIHVQEPYLQDDETQLEIAATISDNIGIGSASVTYSVNGGATQNLPLTLTEPEDSLYTATLNLGTLTDGDEIRYTLSATDNSNSPKTTVSPASGEYIVGVFGFSAAVDSYTNNLNAATSDFFGNGFTVSTPTGFSNPAIHSDHPYAEGDPFPDDELNLVYLLKVPIRIAAENPWLRFDEVVLIEPGDAGSVFGDQNFYDYVVVEGSLDFGETWTPLADGYDSRDKSVWLSRYNSSISGNNSTATGNSTHYRTRGIDLTEVFNPDDEIIIRFRLFSDQLAAGWGWAIDNLYIQDAITATENELESVVSVYPNPAKGNISIEAEGLSSSSLSVQLVSVHGQSVYKTTANTINGNMSHTIDGKILPAGVYFVKISDGKRTSIKKIIKVN
ncbi:MAG: T9SS type A sorting domain-containing protein [Cyclobacteriaceae bacterium]